MFSISVFRVVARALLFYYSSQNIKQSRDYYLPFLRHYYRSHIAFRNDFYVSPENYCIAIYTTKRGTIIKSVYVIMKK